MNNAWQTVTRENYASHIALTQTGGYTVIRPEGPAAVTTQEDGSLQVAAYYYEQSRIAFDYYAAQGNMSVAYYYAYMNAASALYYQNAATDYEAAIIGYYVNTGYGLLYYYMIQGYTNYGLYLYNANLAFGAYTLGYYANFHTFSGLSQYYYYLDADPAAALAYYTQEMTLAAYYRQFGYYSDELAQY